MYRFKSVILFSIVLLLIACDPKKEGKDLNTLKHEVAMTEQAFESAVKTMGLAEAFYLYADNNAVIKRENDTLIVGRDNIRKYYQDSSYHNATVRWIPDFIEVSEDGTLGYTYGHYVWRMDYADGQGTESTGVFHTVWKRQHDNTWRYVWD